MSYTSLTPSIIKVMCTSTTNHVIGGDGSEFIHISVCSKSGGRGGDPFPSSKLTRAKNALNRKKNKKNNQRKQAKITKKKAENELTKAGRISRRSRFQR